MGELKLRLIKDDDFEPFYAMMSDFDGVRMTMSWPWPPDPDFTRMRMNTEAVKSGDVLAIEADRQFVGQISLVNGEIGYGLARAYWGKGIATWAVQQMLERGFLDPETKVIMAGTWEDNPASMRVLEKCGFVKTGEALVFCKSRGLEVNGPDYEVTRDTWIRSFA